MGVESYKHQFAKMTLAQWLRDLCEKNHDDFVEINPISWRINRGPPHYGVWIEYPICLDKNNEIHGLQAWDEQNWDDSLDQSCLPKPGSLLDVRPPSYDEVVAMGLLPIVIFDVAIQHKGNICCGFEVVHRNDISEIKKDFLDRIRVPTYAIDADWILSRIRRPNTLVCKRVA